MTNSDLSAPTAVGPFAYAKQFSARPQLRVGGFFILCALLSATQCRAQDVAGAARQERARKQAQQKKSKHVYTEDDLKRAQILTPEDRAQLEAQKNQSAPPAADQSQQPADASKIGGTPVPPLIDTSTFAIDASRIGVAPIPSAQSLPPDAPLGDVARYFRQWKRYQNLQRSTEFHLPFAEAPVLASPKVPLQPLGPPLQPSRPTLPVPQPFHPRFAPSQPIVKRSPFARPGAPAFAPPRVHPFQPLTRPMAPAPASRRGFPISALPPAVRPRSISPFVPDATARLNQVTIRPGDSLWKIAAQNLGEARRWHELLALNPAILNSNYIVAGTRLYLPATSVVASNRTPKKFTVHRGDTLSQIAQSRLGHASYAACIAQANPSIHDLNRIYAGQSLILPAMCKP